MIGGYDEVLGDYYCYRCGHKMIVLGNESTSDLGYADEDNDFLVSIVMCDHCGARMEINDTPEKEKDEYPYWKTK